MSSSARRLGPCPAQGSTVGSCYWLPQHNAQCTVGLTISTWTMRAAEFGIMVRVELKYQAMESSSFSSQNPLKFSRDAGARSWPMLKCLLKQPALRWGQGKGRSLPSQALTLQLLWPPPPTPTCHPGGARAKLCCDQAGCISGFPFAWPCPCFLVDG